MEISIEPPPPLASHTPPLLPSHSTQNPLPLLPRHLHNLRHALLLLAIDPRMPRRRLRLQFQKPRRENLRFAFELQPLCFAEGCEDSFVDAERLKSGAVDLAAQREFGLWDGGHGGADDVRFVRF